MKQFLGACALVFFSVAALADDNLILAGKWYSMQSAVMGEERDYAVYLPPSYDDESRRFPVMYVLDGDQTRFRGIVGMVEGLSTENLEKQVPEYIIVAVPNTDRTRDLTPTHTLAFFKGQVSDELATSGGADRFLDFFEQDLFPKIEGAYRTNGSRMLVGESYGGLFAAHALLSGRNLFSHYVVADATYIWDDNFLNRELAEKRESGAQLQGKIFMSFANNAAFGEMGETNLAWGKAFAAGLEAQNSDVFTAGHQYFEHETHGTVALLTWYYGLRAFYPEGAGE